MNAYEAIELLENYVDEWMTNPTSNLAIKAPAGIGKSTVILKHVAIEAQTKYIELYVYTHELAEQMKAALLKLNKHLNVVVVRGRTNQKSEKSLPLCDKHELVNKISGYGYNIYETLCKDCEYNKNESCKYLAQYNDDVNVRIFNHAHLPLSRGALAKKYPDFAVIDETFYIRMLLEYEFTFDQIEQHIKNAELSETIIESLKNKAPLLISLKETIGDNLVSVLQSESNNLIIKLPKITDPFFEKKLTQNLKIKLQLSKMLGQLALEVENFPERKHAATVKYVQNKVIFRVRQDLTRFNIKKGKQVPVLCIDADYEQKLGKLFFKIKQKELYVNRNVYVTQTYTTQNSKKRVLPKHDSAEKTKESAEEHIKNLQQIINNVIKEHGNTLVVSYLSLVGDEKLKIESKFVKQAGCEFAHFGALRGLNKFEHCNAAIIIGRHQLPFDVVDSQAAAMWWDSKKELVLTDRPKNDVRGYVSKFKVLGVKVAICNDWRSNLLLELQREREALQAIDRLRVIREVKKKYVYILSSVPLNISVNKLVKHSDLINGKTAIERALLASPHNVLLLSPTILAKTKPYSDIFKSIDNTNKELKKEGLSDREEVNYLLKYKRQVEFNFRRFNIILYRVVGERGGHKKALAPCSMRINIVKKHLQTLHHKSIIIIDSTYTGGFAAIEVKPTKEDIFDILYQHERYYNNKIGEWCIDV